MENHGKSPCLVANLTISMAIFHSYLKLPEGTSDNQPWQQLAMGKASQMEVWLEKILIACLTMGGSNGDLMDLFHQN